MASYTDKAPTFSPYVDQLPVEMMTKVGMAKQAQYQQGYEKIQQSIDKVAGLELYRDVDKGYMQSKLNELGTKLKGVAAGDFSNFQLTNSVAGMAGHIANDKIVQAGVYSTSRLKSEAARIKELEKKGLTDANNDAFYGQLVSAYTDNQELTDEQGNPITFNGSYTPWTDIIGKMKDALKDAGENEDIVESLFVMQNGKPIKDSNGKYVYADVKTIEKLTSNKDAVLGAINTVFSQGDVKQQLQIDGWAAYRNTDVSELLPRYEALYEEQKVNIAEKQTEVASILAATNLSDKEREYYTKVAEDFEATRIKTEANIATTRKNAIDNPEAFKQNYYTQEFVQSIERQFLKQKRSETTGVNEGKQQQNWDRRFEFDIKKEANDIKLAQIDDAREDRKVRLDELKFEADYYVGKDGKLRKRKSSSDDSDDDEEDDPTTFVAAQPGVAPDYAVIMSKRIDNLTISKYNQALDIFVNASRQYDNNPNKPKQKIIEELTKAARVRGVSVNSYLNDFVQNIDNRYASMGLIASPLLQEQVAQFNITSTSLSNNQLLKDKVKSDAYEKAGVNSEIAKIKNLVPLVFNYGGRKYSLSPAEVLEVQRNTDAHGNVSAVASAKFNDNQKLLIKALMSTSPYSNGHSNISYEEKNKLAKDFVSYLPHAQSLRQKYNDADKIYKEDLSNVITVPGAVVGPVDVSKPEKTKRMSGILAAYANRGEYTSTKNSTSKEEVLLGLDPSNIISVTYKGIEPDLATGVSEWKGEVIVNTKDKGVITFNSINQKDFETIAQQKFGDKIPTPIENRIRASTTNSTNFKNYPGSKTAWESAYFSTGDNTATIKKAGYVYRADAIKTAKGYQLAHYIKTPNSNSFTTIYDNFISQDEHVISSLYQGMTIADIKGLYAEYQQNQKK